MSIGKPSGYRNALPLTGEDIVRYLGEILRLAKGIRSYNVYK